MPYRRKGSRFWYITYTDASGQRARESSGTTDRREAEELERRRRSEAWAASRLGEAPPRAVDEVLLKYLEHLGETAAGVRAEYAARHLHAAFSGQTNIPREAIVAYRRDRAAAGASGGTVRKELGVLSAAHNYCRSELGWEIQNPAQGRLGKKPPGRLRWITRAEGEALIESAKRQKRAPHLWKFIQLGLFTGMRRDEMLRLEWARVDLGAGLIYLRPADAKARRYDSVPINQRARAALEALSGDHDRWVFTYRGQRIQRVQKSFRGACAAAGIEDFRIHDMRHTCAAWLVQAGVSLREVAEILRHSDIRTTMLYAHLAPETTRQAVSVLDL